MKLDKVVSKSMLRSIAIGIGIFWATDFIKQQAQAHGYRKFKDGQYESAIFEYKKALLFDLEEGHLIQRECRLFTLISAHQN